MPRIYQTQFMGEAHLRVALVNHPGRADLCVHRVNAQGYANKPGLWWLTYDKQLADCWIYFCDEGMADIKICFVDNYTQAGWQTSTPSAKALAVLR